jgi:two-component system response regulator DesR
MDAWRSGDPIRVLLVEDHPGFRMVLRALLESDERLIVLDAVGTADEACEHHLIEDIDVALVDIGLPGTNGIEATKRLRLRNTDLRVLIMSGSGFERAADEALAAGADKYLEKGALHNDLIEAIVEAGERVRTSAGAVALVDAGERIETSKGPEPARCNAGERDRTSKGPEPARCNAGERDRTSKGPEAHRDLNPARLPVPPRPRGH